MVSPSEAFTTYALARQEAIDTVLENRQNAITETGYITVKTVKVNTVCDQHHALLKYCFENYKRTREEVKKAPGNQDANLALTMNKTVYLRIHKETPDLLNPLQELMSRLLVAQDHCSKFEVAMVRFDEVPAPSFTKSPVPVYKRPILKRRVKREVKLVE